MKERRKKTLVGLVVMIMFFVMNVGKADASEAGQEAAARIGETEYATLTEAVAAVKMGETITLLKNNSEEIAPDTAFFIEGAEYTGSISAPAAGSDTGRQWNRYTLQQLGENRYVVNGYAYTYMLNANADYYDGTLNEVFKKLQDDQTQWKALAWDGEAEHHSMYGVGLWGDTILTEDLPSLSNVGWSSSLSIVVMDDLVFDMHGCSYTQNGGTGYGGYALLENHYPDGAELVIRDSVGGGCLTGAAYAVHSYGGTVTLESGMLASDNNLSGTNTGSPWNVEATVRLDTGADFIMNGGNISNSGDFYESSSCILIRNEGSQVNLNGGTLVYDGEPKDAKCGIVVLRDKGDANDCAGASISISEGTTVTGYIGNIYAKDENEVPRGALTILGGTFSIEEVKEPEYNGTYYDYLFDSVPSILCLTENAEQDTLSVAKHELEITEGTLTCTSNGTRDIIHCGHCDNYFTSPECAEVISEKEAKKEVLATGSHTWDTSFTVDQAPTCTEPGKRSVHCKYYEECHGAKYEIEIPATGHSFGEWETVSSPNCTDKGSRKRECSACRYVETEDLDPAGHSWENEFTVDKEVACTEDGSKSVHCKNCEAKKYSTVIPAMGHSYADGKCSVCGEADPDFKPEDGKESARTELIKETSYVKAMIEAGQQNYTDESWKNLIEIYTVVQNLPENADPAVLKEMLSRLAAAKESLKLVMEVPGEPTELALGVEAEFDGGRYRVIDAKKKTAKLVRAKNKKKSALYIPSKVTIKGVVCKVVSIGPGAFKGFKRLKKITLSKNIKVVGRQAFYGCKKLCRVVVKGTALRSVKQGAFKNTSSKMTVTFTRKMKAKRRAALLKKMKKAGMKRRRR